MIKIKNKYFFFLTIILFFAILIFLSNKKESLNFIKKHLYETLVSSKNSVWNHSFKIVEIKSSLDNKIQKAYFYKSKSKRSRPLVVSLHTWDGYFDQADELAKLCKLKDLNYIHPDFRGANKTKEACCSELAINDIDDAISFAIKNSNTDINKIFVVGISGGGFATLGSFMKSKHKISKFSAWAPITDLIAWYNESESKKSKFADDILKCTDSKEVLLIDNAKLKSPIYWKTPVLKLEDSQLFIYAGIYDGIMGSVPITHSLNFYNKLLNDLFVSDSTKYVSTREKESLLKFREPLGDYGSIADRKIFLKKEFKNIKLVIFEGNHEMLPEFALNELLEEYLP